MNRAERRRQARRIAREGSAQMELAAERGEIPISFFTDTGQYDNAAAGVDLPKKVVGEHRWVATAAYTMDENDVVNEQRFQAGDPLATKTVLDGTRRWQFGIGCIDCEKAFPAEIKPGSVCPLPAYDEPI